LIEKTAYYPEYRTVFVAYLSILMK